MDGPCNPSMEFAHSYEGDDPGRVHDWFSRLHHRDPCPEREVIPANGQIIVAVEAPFVGSREPGETNDAPPSGTYQVYVNWPMDERGGHGATVTFTCPETQCS